MTATLIGYARCSTAQRQLLLGLGVASDRIYLHHGLTGTNRNRPGLNQALAAVRAGDTLVVPSSTGSPGRCPMLGPSATHWSPAM